MHRPVGHSSEGTYTHRLPLDGLKLVQSTLEGLKDNTPELKGELPQ